MGRVLQASCTCGYESESLLLGGGMMDFRDRCNVPYYCDYCEIVSTANIIKKPGAKTDDDLISSEDSDNITHDIKCKKCGRKVQYYGQVRQNDFESETDYIFGWNFGNNKIYLLKD
ncbi:hypothetical protein JXB12_00005, partial [candidate division KSB1 bacterium]|nr:hypothetical protein [candidate division KSB1 bacterium]